MIPAPHRHLANAVALMLVATLVCFAGLFRVALDARRAARRQPAVIVAPESPGSTLTVEDHRTLQEIASCLQTSEACPGRVVTATVVQPVVVRVPGPPVLVRVTSTIPASVFVPVPRPTTPSPWPSPPPHLLCLLSLCLL